MITTVDKYSNLNSNQREAINKMSFSLIKRIERSKKYIESEKEEVDISFCTDWKYVLSSSSKLYKDVVDIYFDIELEPETVYEICLLKNTLSALYTEVDDPLFNGSVYVYNHLGKSYLRVSVNTATSGLIQSFHISGVLA